MCRTKRARRISRLPAARSAWRTVTKTLDAACAGQQQRDCPFGTVPLQETVQTPFGRLRAIFGTVSASGGPLLRTIAALRPVSSLGAIAALRSSAAGIAAGPALRPVAAGIAAGPALWPVAAGTAAGSSLRPVAAGAAAGSALGTASVIGASPPGFGSGLRFGPGSVPRPGGGFVVVAAVIRGRDAAAQHAAADNSAEREQEISSLHETLQQALCRPYLSSESRLNHPAGRYRAGRRKTGIVHAVRRMVFRPDRTVIASIDGSAKFA